MKSLFAGGRHDSWPRNPPPRGRLSPFTGELFYLAARPRAVRQAGAEQIIRWPIRFDILRGGDSLLDKYLFHYRKRIITALLNVWPLVH